MFRSKPVNVTRLSPLLRRGYVMGYRRARHKARAEMRSMAATSMPRLKPCSTSWRADQALRV